MVLMVSVGCFVQGYLYTWTLTLDYVSGTQSRLGAKKFQPSGLVNRLCLNVLNDTKLVLNEHE